MKKNVFGVFLLALFLCASSVSFAGNKKESSKKIDELNQQVKKFSESGDLQKAMEAAEEAIFVSTQEFGPKSLETAHAMNNAANLYLYSGNALNAERLYKESILILTEKKQKDGLEAADYYYNLGMAYAMQKKYDEASKILNLCLQIRAKELGSKNAETQKAQNTLAQVWEEQKQLSV